MLQVKPMRVVVSTSVADVLSRAECGVAGVCARIQYVVILKRTGNDKYLTFRGKNLMHGIPRFLRLGRRRQENHIDARFKAEGAFWVLTSWAETGSSLELALMFASSFLATRIPGVYH